MVRAPARLPPGLPDAWPAVSCACWAPRSRSHGPAAAPRGIWGLLRSSRGVHCAASSTKVFEPLVWALVEGVPRSPSKSAMPGDGPARREDCSARLSLGAVVVHWPLILPSESPENSGRLHVATDCCCVLCFAPSLLPFCYSCCRSLSRNTSLSRNLVAGRWRPVRARKIEYFHQSR